MQLGWAICMLYQNFLAALISMGIFGLNIKVAALNLKHIKLIILIASFGFFHDFILAKAGFFHITGQGSIDILWLYSLWLLCVSSFNCSLKWLLHTTIWLQILMGALGGMLSYWAAFKLGAIQHLQPFEFTLMIHALDWSISFPMLFNLYHLLGNKLPNS